MGFPPVLPPMIFEQRYLESLGHASCFVGSEQSGEAQVFDLRRDVDAYAQAPRRRRRGQRARRHGRLGRGRSGNREILTQTRLDLPSIAHISAIFYCGLYHKAQGLWNGPKPVPTPSILDEFEYLGFKHGQRLWRSHNGRRFYTWDALHGEAEMFNIRGRHLGALDPQTGLTIKPPVRGRRIDV